MRIGIDVQYLLTEERSGLYSYLWNLVEGLQRLQSPHTIWLFVNGHSAMTTEAGIGSIKKSFGRFPVKKFRHPGRPYRLRLRCQAVSRVDLFQYFSDVAFPLDRRRLNVFVIPDLSTVLFPEWHTASNIAHWDSLLEMARSHGDLILTISENTRQEVARQLGISLDKIKVTPLAAGEQFKPMRESSEVDDHLRRWGLEKGRYVLSVGTLEPRKNHILLLKAYARLHERSELPDDHKVVFAGPKGWLFAPVLEAITQLGLEDHVILLGPVKPLEALYNGAAVMVYPSLYEGFGLPPLEAMACGTPVITSNTSSLPEVVGDCGLMVDPNDVDELASAMAKVLRDENLRNEMSSKGLKRARCFSWEKTAAQTMAAYESAYEAWQRR